jgi:hypothetical protein
MYLGFTYLLIFMKIVSHDLLIFFWHLPFQTSPVLGLSANSAAFHPVFCISQTHLIFLIPLLYGATFGVTSSNLHSSLLLLSLLLTNLLFLHIGLKQNKYIYHFLIYLFKFIWSLLVVSCSLVMILAKFYFYNILKTQFWRIIILEVFTHLNYTFLFWLTFTNNCSFSFSLLGIFHLKILLAYINSTRRFYCDISIYLYSSFILLCFSNEWIFN